MFRPNQAPVHVRIFLSSPGDVVQERQIATRVIEHLPDDPLFRGRVTTQLVAWDKRGSGAPMLATISPQEAINRKLPLPEQCDIVIVILWRRMGTRLHGKDYLKPDGQPYLSGTEWEYENAMTAAQQLGRPAVVVYRRMEKVLLDPDAADYDDLSQQYSYVKAFFRRFVNPDGSMSQGYNAYKTIEDFEADFTSHMKVLINDFLQNGISDQALPKTQTTKRVFLSYSHRSNYERDLAWQFEEVLQQKNYALFSDDQRLIEEQGLGTCWVDETLAHIQKSDYFLLLLSKASLHSEVVLAELQQAYDLRQSSGKPRILPVRIRLTGEFPNPLHIYLDDLPCGVWNSDGDTSQLIEQVIRTLSGAPLEQPMSALSPTVVQAEPEDSLPRPQPFANTHINYEQPNGTMSPQSHFYMYRQGDAILIDQLERGSATVVIKAARQMGKSSLLMQGKLYAEELDKRFGYLDFQILGRETMKDEQMFFKNFCRWIAMAFNLEDVIDVDDYWKPNRSSVYSCTNYMERHILAAANGQPLVLAIDEVDKMFECDFRSDFFGMLRSWHNNRSYNPRWKELDLILSISTEPFMLIPDSHQSPFNVGEVIILDDFTPEQMVELNERHGFPLNNEDLSDLYDLIGGHPYLVREALYQVATNKMTFESLMDTALDYSSPFMDHLNQYLFRLHEDEQLQQALLQIIEGRGLPRRETMIRLRSAGLVQTRGNQVEPRCRLYADYFRRHLSPSLMDE